MNFHVLPIHTHTHTNTLHHFWNIKQRPFSKIRERKLKFYVDLFLQTLFKEKKNLFPKHKTSVVTSSGKKTENIKIKLNKKKNLIAAAAAVAGQQKYDEKQKIDYTTLHTHTHTFNINKNEIELQKK